MKPIVIAAGGTGGHFFPAEALAASLIDRGHRVVLMTDARSGSLQSPIFAGREQYVLRGAGIAGRVFLRAGKAILALGAGTLQARRILSMIDAAAIIGFGGYPSIAPVLAATSLRHRPVVILHEQNAVLGRANRFLARRATLLALGFANTTRIPSGVTTQLIGNPVRPAIQALANLVYQPSTSRIELLVTGGSLGARIFSDVVPQAIAMLPEALRLRLSVTQQCRTEDIERVRTAYRACNVEAELAPFFSDIAAKLARAHLVIARAGASTCAEITVAGRPSILVPLPSAIDDHQSANAASLAASGGADVITQQAFSPTSLESLLSARLADPQALAAAAAEAASCGRASSADDFAVLIESLMVRHEVTA